MAVTQYTIGQPGDHTTRVIKMFIADTEAEIPSSGLAKGDFAVSKDTNKFFRATGEATWAETGGAASGPHAHPEYVHTHPYADLTHNHVHDHEGVYAPVHSHPYSVDTHVHASSGGVQKVTKGADQAHGLIAYGDITGLGFPVVAGQTYRFTYHLIFQSAALTTGFGFSVNGPTAPTVLHYTTTYQTTANAAAGTTDTMTQRNDTAYDAMPALAAAIAATTNLACVIEGVIVPSVGGTLIPRVRSEVAASNITVKRGSMGVLV